LGQVLAPPVPIPDAPPALDPGMRPLPITLPTALQLARVRPLDVAAASQRLRVAAAQLDRAKVLWLPSLQFGVDYFRHDGQIQSAAGDVAGNTHTALFAGGAPNAVFAVADALFAPLEARQVLRAREADLRTAANDSLLAVTEAYFTVQQGRGELAGALDAIAKAEELVRRAKGLAPSLVPPVEAIRAEAELAHRRQAEFTARERWRLASSELLRVLRLDPATQVEPLEPPNVAIQLIRLDCPVDDLIAVALTNRPELASQQALVQATLQRLRAERLRPLVPSVLLRGAATNPTGTLSSGVFGGGVNDTLSNFGARNDLDLQLVWQLDNLGFGYKARVNEQRAQNRLAMTELFRIQDRVAAEASQALAQAQLAARRVGLAEQGLRLSLESYEKNLAGLSQTQRAGAVRLLIVRPQEAVAALQALAQAYAEYYGAVADANRAQFRLYRALGHPAHLLLNNPEAASDEAPVRPQLSFQEIP
jgi:outer membrane protein TolC